MIGTVGTTATPAAPHMFLMGGGPIGSETSPTSPYVMATITKFVAAARERYTGAPEDFYILLVASAKYPAAEYDKSVAQTSRIYGKFGVTVKILHAYEGGVDLNDAFKLIMNAAGIHMPGGSTDNAFDYWKQTGLAGLMLWSIKSGVPFFGHSAGQIIWSYVALTDSNQYGLEKGVPWTYKMVQYLGLWRIAICPHAADNARKYTFDLEAYGPETTRREVFLEELAKYSVPGLAVDGNTTVEIIDDLAIIHGAGVATLYYRSKSGAISSVDLTEGNQFSLAELCSVAV